MGEASQALGGLADARDTYQPLIGRDCPQHGDSKTSRRSTLRPLFLSHYNDISRRIEDDIQAFTTGQS